MTGRFHCTGCHTPPPSVHSSNSFVGGARCRREPGRKDICKCRCDCPCKGPEAFLCKAQCWYWPDCRPNREINWGTTRGLLVRPPKHWESDNRCCPPGTWWRPIRVA